LPGHGDDAEGRDLRSKRVQHLNRRFQSRLNQFALNS
jgi:hypothetical protein